MATFVDIRPHQFVLEKGQLSMAIGPATAAGEKLTAGASTTKNTTAFPDKTDYVAVHNRGTTLVMVEVGDADTVAANAATSTPIPANQVLHLSASPGHKIAVIEAT